MVKFSQLLTQRTARNYIPLIHISRSHLAAIVEIKRALAAASFVAAVINSWRFFLKRLMNA